MPTISWLKNVRFSSALLLSIELALVLPVSFRNGHRSRPDLFHSSVLWDYVGRQKKRGERGAEFLMTSSP